MAGTAKVAIVTGSATGLGATCALDLAARGWNVCINYTRSKKEADETYAGVKAKGAEAILVQADVGQDGECRKLVDETLKKWGRVDGLVNNAAVFGTIPISRVGFEQIPEAEWDLVMSVNVKGVWNCCRAAAPALRARGGGSIVNISSASILHAGGGRMHYVASKAAVIGISRVLARELGGDNIRVNSIAPGNTLSEDDPTPEVVAIREAAIAARSLKRLQTPADLVGTVAFLLSDDAAFITGQMLVVDGGTNLH